MQNVLDLFSLLVGARYELAIGCMLVTVNGSDQSGRDNARALTTTCFVLRAADLADISRGEAIGSRVDLDVVQYSTTVKRQHQSDSVSH
jgi:hypothetical protein